MKCQNCLGSLKTITIYQETYLKCAECSKYYTPDLVEIEDILEYKNKIRRQALKKLLNISEIDEDQE